MFTVGYDYPKSGLQVRLDQSFSTMSINAIWGRC